MAKTAGRTARQLPRATLGRRRRTPFTYTPALLEAIPVDRRRTAAGAQAWVALRCLRFTSLCPVTGQPDWADLTINYIPAGRIVESKSLKEYLGSFRMQGDFHEDVCQVIVRDLAALLAPVYLEVEGRFDSRGSIAIWPYVQWARPGDAEAQTLLAARRAAWSPGRYAGDGRVV